MLVEGVRWFVGLTRRFVDRLGSSAGPASQLLEGPSSFDARGRPVDERSS